MNTKLLMAVSAIILGVAGITLTFFPQEINTTLSAPSPGAPVSVFQILGALYFAFAMINWTARANLIGGIYGRPIAIGNLTHFTIGALSLIKQASMENAAMLVCTLVYILFAVAFGVVFFTHPLKGNEK